ncbi:MAG: TetR/AcrR family transcriptional regulator, partial [Pseudomonadota bacterium]
LRSVFRHFDEMDTLYRDMMQSLEEEVLPKIMVPFQSPDLAGRKAEMVERRTAIFERIMPFKVSAGLRRFQSDFMMDSHLRFRMLERATLKANLPPDVSRDPVQFEAIEAALSFETWRRLRQDQSLEIDAAKAAFARLVDALVPG